MKLSDVRLAHLRGALEDRYRFESMIGRGGSGSVFRVHNLKLDRVEALKVLDEADSADEEFGKRFSNEARVAASLDHPGIVGVYDSGDVESIYWFTMQFVAGPTLSQLLRKGGVMHQDQASRLAVPILDALDYSHRRGVIHRDIKPSNIIIDGHGRPHLLDYGIAKAADSMVKTRTGLILGTPAYVAPEQASLKGIDGRADLYALGVTLYEALSGSHHFTADNPLQSVVMRITEDPEPLLDKRADLDPILAAIIMRALARDPVDRFANAAEMRDALIPFAGDGWINDTGEITETRGIEIPVLPANGDDRSQQAIATPPPADQADAGPGRTRRPIRHWWPWAIGTLSAAIILALTLTLGGWPSRGGERLTQVGGDTGPNGEDTNTPVSATDVGPTSLPAKTIMVPEPPTAIPEPEATPTTTPRATASPAPPPRRPVISPRLRADSDIRLPDDVPSVCAGQVVNLSVVVAEDGSVSSARVIAASHAECGEIAEAVVRLFEYEPALAADQLPIEATIAIAVPFKEVSNENRNTP